MSVLNNISKQKFQIFKTILFLIVIGYIVL